MFKKLFVSLMLLFTSFQANAQWQQVWSSSSINYNYLSGWIDFDKSGEEWSKRLYLLDTLKLQVMQQGYSTTPEFTYTFDDAEKAAGYQIYSLGTDLTNDGHPEFYILSYYGVSTNYRQAFKIIDIVTGSTVFEKNDENYYYSYPVIWDMNGDGNLECLVTKYEYPLYGNFYYEVYSTGFVGVNLSAPAQFELKQNFPNPFNPSTEINFTLEEGGAVSLKIYDIKGELIKTLLNREFNPGIHSVEWDGTNQHGTRQASGVYFYELRSGTKSYVKKMMMLK